MKVEVLNSDAVLPSRVYWIASVVKVTGGFLVGEGNKRLGIIAGFIFNFKVFLPLPRDLCEQQQI